MRTLARKAVQSLALAAPVAFLIVETAGHWCVRGAPADVENLGARVGIGLTSGAVGAGDRRGIG